MKRRTFKQRAVSAYRRVPAQARRGGTGFAILAVVGVGIWYALKQAASAAQPALSTVTPSLGPSNLLSPVSPSTGQPTTPAAMSVPASGLWDTLTGTSAPTTSEVASSGSFWSNLTQLGTGVLGYSGSYVNFPSGSQAAASLLPFAADSSGNLYTQWAGTVFLVNTTPDANGNFSATSVG